MSSILAMMFLVIFSSLAAAMAVVAQGNLRTADSALKVSRAHSAAETGLIFARRRLILDGGRFVISKGNVDDAYAEDLWIGTWNPAEGDVMILDPSDGYSESSPPSGIAEAIMNAHLETASITPEPGDSALPTIDSYGTLLVRPVPLTTDPRGPYFRLKYELLSSEPGIRVTSQGVDRDVTRTIQMDFMLEKKIEFAVISPSRIMIGKNVRVEGPLGTRYGIITGELDNANGDPLVLRSDFRDLDDALDVTLDLFFAELVDHDVDGDGRLRVDHPQESVGLSDASLVDYDGDEYVDDFDLFLKFFDANGDKRLSYGPGNEFTLDDQLAELIDTGHHDRNGDGDTDLDDAADEGLGYDDGFLDELDLYAKVSGSLAFAVARAPWDTANGASYQTVVQGPVRTDIDEAPVEFAVADEDLLEITTAMLDSSQTWFFNAADGDDFGDTTTGQVKSNIDSGGIDGLAEYVAPGAASWEPVPYGSQGAYDYYQRPIYRNMIFTDVVIPKGTNALFENCAFVGVTFVETNDDCDHFNWNYAGAMEETAPGTYELKFPDLVAESGGGTPLIVADTRTESNNIRFDSCSFLGSISGDKPNEYTHWRNKMQFTGDTRFYLDPTDPDLLQEDAAVQALIVPILQGFDPADLAEMKKSSILLPGWSVDVGSFDNAAPKVKLKGTIVAGILDARGAVDVHGTLMMTFRPEAGAGPLYYGGQPDAFNTTIGYFGPTDGDGEGIDPSDPAFGGFGGITLRYDPDAVLPDGIPWPVTVETEPTTYVEGGTL